MKNILSIFITGLLLTACQQSSVSTAETDSVTQEKPEANVEVVAQNEQALAETAVIPKAATAKMSGNGLQFTHSTATERAQVGMPFDIDISFVNFSGSSFTAEFKPTPGLELASANRVLINVSEKGLSNPHKITVVAQAEGIYFVNVFQAGATDQKPSAIKIVVGDKDVREYMQTVGEIVEAEDGSKIVSMKADEG